MAAATTLIAGGLAAGGGLLKTFNGMSRARKYENMINNYDRQDLTNYANNIQVSTYGSDLIRDENARNTATIMDAVRRGGSRAIAGGSGVVANSAVNANRAAMSDIDQQQQRREYAILDENARIRQMQERREEADLMGMGAMYEAGRQDMWSGIGDVAQAGMYGMRQIEANRPTTNNGE